VTFSVIAQGWKRTLWRWERKTEGKGDDNWRSITNIFRKTSL